MAVEREIKLRAPDGRVLQAVATDALLLALAKGASWRCGPVEDTYLDSPLLGLLQRRLALRVRQQGGRCHLGLKGNGAVVAGVSIRQEWEEVVAEAGVLPNDLPAGVIRELILPWLDPITPWRILMTVTMERRTLDLVLVDGCLAEVALDCGCVMAAGRRHWFWEVEVEAKAGPFAPVRQLAAQLMGRHNLQCATYSKYSLGLDLLGIRAEEPLGFGGMECVT